MVPKKIISWPSEAIVAPPGSCVSLSFAFFERSSRTISVRQYRDLILPRYGNYKSISLRKRDTDVNLIKQNRYLKKILVIETIFVLINVSKILNLLYL